MKKILYVILAFVICGALLSAFTFANINSGLQERKEKQNAKNCILDGTYIWDAKIDEIGNSQWDGTFLLEDVEFSIADGTKYSYIYCSGGAMFYSTRKDLPEETFVYTESWIYENQDNTKYQSITFDNQKVTKEFYDLIKEHASKVVPVYEPIGTDGPSAGDPDFSDPNIQIDPPDTDSITENPAVPEVTLPSGADLPVIDPGMEGPGAE